MHPKQLSISDYTYVLPEERIAKFPLEERDASKLLVYQDHQYKESTYRNIADYLPANSLLVFNNTRVIEARLLFQKATGGVIEVFCLEPHEQYPDITSALQQKGKVYWQCLVGGASKWKPGQVLEKVFLASNERVTLEARYINKQPGSLIIELSWSSPELSFAEVLHFTGALPLPPYMKRAAESADTTRYQTIYNREEGSVAAPTAGLHFTESIFASLADKNIETAFLTLHVGAGTFKPVKAERMEGHDMHAEFIDVSRELIKKLISQEGPIIAVGTTSLRTLESLYWIGAKLMKDESYDPLNGLAQWEPYELEEINYGRNEALSAILHWMEKSSSDKLICKTSIIIAPGYNLKMANGLVTNFHQPQSTLLLLVAAMIGEDWKKLYNYAMENGFRFLSYGDGMLLIGEAGS